jgi:hypothetical protein
MAVVMKRFFYHEKGNHDETWYYLARDTESGAIHIEHEWAERGNLGSKRIGVAEFLSGRFMTARDTFLNLSARWYRRLAMPRGLIGMRSCSQDEIQD